MLFRRVAVAAVGAPLVLLVTAAGTWWTAALAAVLSFLAGLEARSLWRALGLGLPTLGVVAAAAAAPVGAA
ncbi:MAG: hypothetical protein IRY95_03960, partial [Clostridia bacterium]|nr:hypothetical protein [Clostridia bacterium]